MVTAALCVVALLAGFAGGAVIGSYTVSPRLPRADNTGHAGADGDTHRGAGQ